MKTASDELYEEILRERTAWKQAKHQEIEAVLRLAGDAVVGGCSGGCGCHGCSEDPTVRNLSVKKPSAHRTRREARNEDPRQNLIAVPGAAQVGLGRFQLPSFTSVTSLTRTCFEEEGFTDWPSTRCIPPLVHAKDECEPPNLLEYSLMSLAVPYHEFLYQERLDMMQTSVRAPDAYDRQLFGAAMSVLMKNIDIVRWVTCLAASWSPEMRGLNLVQELNNLLTIQNGQFPFSITYIGFAQNGATMAAITLLDLDEDPGVNEDMPGLIIMIDEQNPQGNDTIHAIRKENWKKGGAEAFCASVAFASEILHEMIHILADGYTGGDRDHHMNFLGEHDLFGALHDDVNLGNHHCWDEARMIGTMFVWAMAQRYSCLGDISNPCCVNMSNDYYFAFSDPTQSQIMGNCR